MIRLSEQNGGVYQNVDKVIEKVRSRTHMRGNGRGSGAGGVRAEPESLCGDTHHLVPFYIRPTEDGVEMYAPGEGGHL